MAGEKGIQPQIRTAKAVVDIDEIHFLAHGASGEPTINTALFGSESGAEGWFSAATLKGSVEVTQDPLSMTKVNIDQSTMPIGISTEPGDFKISFEMPSMVSARLEEWLDKGSTAVVISGKSGYGYDFNAELKQMVVVVKAKTGEYFVFPNVEGSVYLKQDNKVFVLAFDGQVLGASNASNNDVYILSEASAS